jgi:6,7-dimethyl-8-ribityllumazine synthase
VIPVAGDAESPDRTLPKLDGSGVRVAVLCGRFNDLITRRLLAGVRRGLASAGVAEDAVAVAWVPGAFELPFVANAHARSGLFDAIVVIGAVIRGETSHYELVSGECARGVQDVQLATGVPVLFGVLTTENLDQALARSEDPGGHNVGEECALGAVEVVGLVRGLRERMA